MTRIPVALGDRSYPVEIEPGLLDDAGRLLRPMLNGRPVVIVTDEHVAQAQAPRLTASLDAAGISYRLVTLPAGEATKSWAQLEALCETLLSAGVERNDHLIALGGGVIGDLVGFAAAIIKRGCRFVQIPTTLLAQVDSSVGGKTAINARAGKNLVGAFHQPAMVLIDPTVLRTLSPRELAAGYAEVVKYGLIDRPTFFAWCEEHGPALLDGDEEARAYAIAESVTAKASIVAADERETAGVRALLNLGHTFGHALEAEAGFSDRLLHGEAIAAGMALAHRYSVHRGLCSAEDADRVAAHLRAAKLPASLAEAGINASGERLVEHMTHDKKMEKGRLTFLLTRGIGRTFLARDVELADVAAFLDNERG